MSFPVFCFWRCWYLAKTGWWWVKNFPVCVIYGQHTASLKAGNVFHIIKEIMQPKSSDQQQPALHLSNQPRSRNQRLSLELAQEDLSILNQAKKHNYYTSTKTWLSVDDHDRTLHVFSFEHTDGFMLLCFWSTFFYVMRLHRKCSTTINEMHCISFHSVGPQKSDRSIAGTRWTGPSEQRDTHRKRSLVWLRLWRLQPHCPSCSWNHGETVSALLHDTFMLV